MRRSSLLLCVLPIVVLVDIASAQDFDPRGRRRNPPAGGPRPAGPGPTVTKGPTHDVLIARYTAILLRDPGLPFPLARLAQVYRERDGNILKLIADFESRARTTGPEQYASQVVLAGIYRLDGKQAEAIQAYEKAIAQKPTEPAAILALARVHQDRGEAALAQRRLEQALPLLKQNAERENVVRTLMVLGLDQKDWALAKRYHVDLVRLASGSVYVKGELGRELYNRGEFARAVVELGEFVKSVAGDNRTLAPALRDLGRAEAKAGQPDAAVATLRRALSVAGPEAGVRAEIFEIIADVYRASQRLPLLIKELSAERPSDFARLSLLGSLYEETGDGVRAMEAYRSALAVNPRQIDLRLRVIRILQANGEIDKAIAEYDALIKAAPHNPGFVFEQCEALLSRGDRARVLSIVSQLEARAGTDDEVLSRVADFYNRIGEGDRALKVLKKLAQVSTHDPTFLVDLGDRYFQAGDRKLAMETWKQILVRITPRHRALQALGEVYLDHDLTSEAQQSFEEAVRLDPNNLTYKKQLALSLERQRDFDRALALYWQIRDRALATGNRALVREARTRYVVLAAQSRRLPSLIAAWESAWEATPPDFEAGRTLAEAYIHTRRLPNAEAVLQRLTTLVPGDFDSHLTLERTLIAQSKVEAAIAALEKWAEVEPKRAREIFQRMSQYALQIYRDDDAIKYAVRVVELGPEDAEGHRRLADMYRSRQQNDKAIASYRAALTRNDRLYPVYLQLGDLLMARGDREEADRLFRRVVRGAPDEDVVGRAARLSMQIHLGKPSLESLEQDLLPLAIGNPHKPVYRRLLLEVYRHLTHGHVQRVRFGSAAEAALSHQELQRIGRRAIKPLLDGLGEGDATSQRMAIDVLTHVDNKNAALPLFVFATGRGDLTLRYRAMIAAGNTADAALVPRLTGLLFPKGQKDAELSSSDSVALAAVYALGKIPGRESSAALLRALSVGTPTMRVVASLALASRADGGTRGAILEGLRYPDLGAMPRAALLSALGEVGSVEDLSLLDSSTHDRDSMTSAYAIVAAARLRSRLKQATPAAVSDSLLETAMVGAAEGDPAERDRVLRASLSALVLGRSSATPQALPPLALAGLDPTRDVEQALAELVPALPGPLERAAIVSAHSDAIGRVLRAALLGPVDVARVALERLDGPVGSLTPLIDHLPYDGTEAARGRAAKLTEGLLVEIVSHARHPSAEVRKSAVQIAARHNTPLARATLRSAVDDPSDPVARTALMGLGLSTDLDAEATVVGRLRTATSWPIRVECARALARIGRHRTSDAMVQALAAAASDDAFALVREEAFLALGALDSPAQKLVATRQKGLEQEPRMVKLLERVLSGERIEPALSR